MVDSSLRITRTQARQLDQLAQEELGLPGVVLMENAGINATREVVRWLDEQVGVNPSRARVVVVCGGGNNGGDGYVCARQLHNHGAEVIIYTAKDPGRLKGDAAVNHSICQRMGLAIHVLDKQQTQTGTLRANSPPGPWPEAHVVIDAVLGTGFQGEVRDHEATVIQAINALTRPSVVSLDTPSGLDCDTGKPANACVRADLTVTFAAAKIGFDQGGAEGYTGRVVVGRIGTPPELLERVVGSAWS